MHTWNLLNSLKQLVGKEFEKPSCDKKGTGFRIRQSKV